MLSSNVMPCFSSILEMLGQKLITPIDAVIVVSFAIILSASVAM